MTNNKPPSPSPHRQPTLPGDVMQLVQQATVAQVLAPEVRGELVLAEVVGVALQTLEGHRLADTHQGRGRGGRRQQHRGLRAGRRGRRRQRRRRRRRRASQSNGVGIPHHGAAHNLLDKVELGLRPALQLHLLQVAGQQGLGQRVPQQLLGRV